MFAGESLRSRLYPNHMHLPFINMRTMQGQAPVPAPIDPPYRYRLHEIASSAQIAPENLPARFRRALAGPSDHSSGPGPIHRRDRTFTRLAIKCAAI